MIYYQPDCDLRFQDFGIEIPIEDDRAKKVFQELKVFPTTPTKDIPVISREDLELVHTEDYVSSFFHPLTLEKSIIFSYELVNHDGSFNRYNPEKKKKNWNEFLDLVLKQVGLTYMAASTSLTTGFSYHLGGGMHHAKTFSGGGFCLINDIAIAIKKLQKENQIKLAWVIDVDAHQGDGTAEIFSNDESVKTFSIHMKDGWPFEKSNSDLDIAVSLLENKNYNQLLLNGLKEMESRFEKPDLVIVVNGADPFEFDELPSTDLLNLSKEEMLTRDKMVYEFFKERKIPQTYLMAGGYGKRSWEIYLQFLKFVREHSS